MDKTILLQLIARGESSSLDFKRELNLESARDKAEFVKDLIAIANSVDEVGHLVIGVKDDGSVVGTKRLQKKNQQIARRYIEPMPKLFIDHNAVEIEGREVLLALVSVQPTSLPHKVRKAIERLEQDEVFVRDGTVVSRAGPDEVLRLYRKQNLPTSDLGAYLHAARRHSNSRITKARSRPLRPQLISILHWICFLNAQTLVVNITASLRIKTNSYWLQKQFLKISKTH